jgi:tryptophan halogenase
MSEGAAVRQVVILGGGIAGWLTAAALARAAGPLISITLIEQDGPDAGIGPFGTAEGSLPAFPDFLKLLAINEDALIAGGGASFSAGIVYSGFYEPGRSYIQPFGETGAPIGPASFYHLATRLRLAGQRVRLGDYSLAAMCAQSGRFARPNADPRSIHSSYGYGLNIDSSAFASAVRAQAERNGVVAKAGPARSLEIAPSGDLSALLTDDLRIEGDLFIDCSGPKARLIGEALQVPFQDCSRWLPCDRVAAADRPDQGAPPLFVLAEASENGWIRRVPLPGRSSELLIWSSAFPGPDMQGASSFINGYRTAPWTANCIALGAAAGILEPLDGAGLALLQQGIARLIALFPTSAGGTSMAVEAKEFNRLAVSAFERARDMAILHYHANARHGEPLWDHLRSVEVPGILAHKMQLFRSFGHIALYDEETFDESSWMTVLDEQGLAPQSYDVVADHVSLEQASEHFAKLKSKLIDALRAIPPHGDYLRKVAAAVR